MDLNKPTADTWPAESEDYSAKNASNSLVETPRTALESCVDEFNPAFTIVEPAVQTVPVVFSSPHSGRIYPDAFLAASKLDARSIRRSEDAFVDELISEMPSLGAPILCAEFPRAYCDVNREAFELDPSMFVEALPEFANSNSLRVASGLGTIARVVADGEDIYHGKLTLADARARVEKLYRPYHAALKSLLESTKDQFGFAILIDCHSMPSKITASRDRTHGKNIDMILGDRFGTSCAPKIIKSVERVLQSQDLKVSRNDPFAGGFCTEFYGLPHTGIHALQIEINRRLYMDERTLSRTEGLTELRQKITQITEALSNLNSSELITR
jgi:N-formylglutamate amidohydrolase